MTNEEAINVLEADKAYLYPDECYNTGAYDMAIEALRRKALVDKMTKAYYKELRGEADND